METHGTGPFSVRPSVVEPISRALDWTGQVLFRPFDVKKWFILGFCAWLAWLGERGGGGFNWNVPSERAKGELGAAQDWALAHLALVITLVIVVILFAIALGILFTWISSRGKFMFLDGVVRDRAAVVDPWKRFRVQGNSLFVFRILLLLSATVAILLAVGLILAAVFGMGIDEGEPGPAQILVVLVLATPVILLAFGLALVVMAINDFVVPIMWVRQCGAVAAWRELIPIVSSRIGTFVLYVLLKIVIAALIFGVTFCVVCLTCCIAAIPYLGTVLLLPLLVFHRSYSIYFLSQFDPAYASLAPEAGPPPAPPAAPPPAAPAPAP